MRSGPARSGAVMSEVWRSGAVMSWDVISCDEF